MTNHAFQKSVLKVIGVFILALGFVVLASWLSAKIENPDPQLLIIAGMNTALTKAIRSFGIVK